jgi:hypothetical protein
MLNRDKALGKVMKYIGPTFQERRAKLLKLGDKWLDRPVRVEKPHLRIMLRDSRMMLFNGFWKLHPLTPPSKNYVYVSCF